MKKNSLFFTYEEDNLNQFADDGKIVGGSKGGFSKKAKLILTILVGLAGFFLIVQRSLDKLGLEKAQSVKYESHTNLSYPVKDIPRLLPVHQFTFFNRTEVIDRIKCITYGDKDECLNIEIRRCMSKGNTTEAYENCMIRLLDTNGKNST